MLDYFGLLRKLWRNFGVKLLPDTAKIRSAQAAIHAALKERGETLTVKLLRTLPESGSGTSKDHILLMATLTKHFAKHLYPVLKAHGFTRRKPFWATDPDQPWRAMVELSSSQLQDGRWYVELDIGLFSYEIDAMTDAKAREIVCERSDLPLGVITSHFQASIFDLNNDAEWALREGQPHIFSNETEAERAIRQISEKFSDIFQKLCDRYANNKALIDCKYELWGSEARGKKNGLFAAAACILLGRYDEARAFLEESIRPGSMPYDKKIGDELRALLPG